MQIQVRINEEGTLRNQRFAFTDRYTLISELLQNARRAGASHIAVTYDLDKQCLVVTDDGRGIEDFQKLLTFNESGWDSGTCEREHPFGVGFSKCLYAASRCVVTSGQQQVDFESASALDRAVIEVLSNGDSTASAGTRIELHGVDLPDLTARMPDLCRGFPVPVDFNGTAVERPHALPSLACIPTDIGYVHLAGTRDGKYSSQTFVYLQGFCVLRMGYYYVHGDINVVHLNPQLFQARLPDRDKLIDEKEQHDRIYAQVKACWRKVLKDARFNLGPQRFVKDYYAAMRHWGHLDLLNTVDALPQSLFESISGYPIQEGAGSREYLSIVSVAPTRQDIEDGKTILVELDPLDESNAGFWMFAKTKGYLVFDVSGLAADHWIQAYVRRPEEQTLSITPVSEQIRTELDGRWIWAPVVLCETVRIHVGSDFVDISDEGVVHGDTLLIPAHEFSGESVRQLSDFEDGNDQFQEGDLDADRDSLAALIGHLRSVDPVQTLNALLVQLRLGTYPLLQGKAFEVRVGNHGTPSLSIALVE